MTRNSAAPRLSPVREMISEVAVRDKVRELAQRINRDYAGKEVTAVCILKGGVVFFSDIIRNLDMPIFCEFIGTTSYGAGTKTSGEVKLTLDTNAPLEGKHVVVFEDIVDSGLTLAYIVSLLLARRPASLKVCSLLFKPESLKADIRPDYYGFSVGNEFVVGYGLDYAGLYRGLPYIGILSPPPAA